MYINYNLKLKDTARKFRNKPTKSETIFWNFLKSNFSEFHFMRQKPLGHFVADFYCSKLNLIIEIDGEIHNSQIEKDKERDNYFLQKHKIRTLRISNSLILGNLKMLKEILERNTRT